MSINSFLSSDNITIVTPTERVARDLRGRRAFLKRTAGETQWDDPSFIGTFRRYCTDQWESLFDGRQLLHPEQLLTLCKQAIDSSGSGDTVISSMSMARKMRQAERLIREYRIDVGHASAAFGSELSAFIQWHEVLSKRLATSDYLTEYDLPAELSVALREGKWEPGELVVFYGFVSLTPSERHFAEVLKGCGVRVEIVESQVGKSSQLSHMAESQEEEVADAAHWLRHQIKSVPSGQRPPRCALIVPELDRHRGLIRQVLDRELAPNSLLAGRTPDEVENVPWFAFAGGSYLAELPWLRSVLDLLAIKRADNSAEDLSRFLLGFSSPLDRGLHLEAARLDLKMRRTHGWKVRGESFVKLLSSSRHMGFRHLADTLSQWLESSDALLLPSAWANAFEMLVRNAGYLNGDRMIRSEIYQWHAFQDALDVLRSLDAQMGELTYEPIYRWLDEICHTRRFSHDKASQAPVQVLAPEEAYGLRFDRVWVLAAEAKNFPGPVEPNPFLPVSAQVNAEVPFASSELNTEHSQKLVDHLIRCGAGVVLSIHESSGGSPCLRSGLINWDRIAPLDMKSFKAAGPKKPIRVSAKRTPDVFPKVSKAERERLAGGVSIFADFAEDRLSAALIHRLHLKPFPAISAGLTGAVQGNLIHDALNLFWSTVRTSEKLHSLAPARLKQKVSDSVVQAIEESKDVSEARHGRNLLALERFRISDLVLSWLEFEKQRVEPFEVVVAEGASICDIEGMSFKVRIDRIDRVRCSDGQDRYVIIDYKTGQIVDMRALNSDRLTAPQLPLYATFTDLKRFGIETPHGVSLAKVFSGDLQFHLRSDWAEGLMEGQGVESSELSAMHWAGQLEGWRKALISNAKGFLSGESVLSYRPHEYLGNHEHLEPLMRLGDT